MANGKKIADLFVELSLNTTQFAKGIRQAVNSAKSAAAQIAKALGQETAQANKKVVKEFRDLGDKSKKVIKSSLDAMTSHFKLFSLKNSNYVKDVSRIVTGILVSKAFYTFLRNMREAVAAVSEFAQQTEKAVVAFSILLGSESKAKRFLDALADFAATTPFQLQQARHAAQQLLAMGYSYQSIIPVLRTLLDASAIGGGDPEVLDRIVLAMGKIQTTGFLAAREVLALAKARLPIIDILREELKLTDEQIKNIGKLKIRSEIAIAAILRGLDKRFKGASILISRTFPGLISTIKDNLLIIGAEMSKGIYEVLKKWAESLVSVLEVYRQVIRQKGIVGLLQELIPPEVLQQLYTIGSSLRVIGRAVKRIASIFKDSFGIILQFGIALAAKVIPWVAYFISKLSELYDWANKNIPILKYLLAAVLGFKILPLISGFVVGFAKALSLLNIAAYVADALRALSLAIKMVWIAISSHPIAAVITAVAASLSVLIARTKTAQAALAELSRIISSFIGVHTPTIINEEDAQIQDEFNKAYEETANITDKIGEAAQNAQKKVQDFLASFDEVVTVPKQLEDANVMLSELGEEYDEAAALGDIALPGLDLPEMELPSLTAWFDSAKSQLSSFKDNVINTFRSIFAYIINWDADTTKQIIRTVSSWVGVIDSYLEKAVKAIANFSINVLGELLGWDEQTTQVISSTIDEWISKFFDFEETVRTKLTEFVLLTVDLFANWGEQSRQIFAQWIIDTLFSIVDWSRQMLGTLVSWATDWVGNLLGWDEKTTNVVKAAFEHILTYMAEWTKLTIEKFVEWASNTLGIITDWDTSSLEKIKLWVQNTVTKFSEWIGETLELFEDWSGQMLEIFAAWALSLLLEVEEWSKNIKETFNSWVEEALDQVEDWKARFIEHIMQWASETKKRMDNWISETKQKLAKWSVDVKTKVQQDWIKLRQGLRDVWKGIKEDAIRIWDGITESIRGALNSIVVMMNVLIDKINSIKIKVPKVTLPGGASFGGYEISLPRIPRIPYLKDGGIVDKATLAMIGEGRYPETVLPLSKQGLRPFAEALLEVLKGYQTSNVVSQGSMNYMQQPQILYVGNLIADERSLKELERKLKIYRIQEAQRRGE